MKLFYSAESAHGSDSSRGFANDKIVKAFDSKARRDSYVENSRNISCKAIMRGEAIKYAKNYNETNAPKPFSGEYWAIIEPYEWISRHDGFIGTLGVASGNGKYQGVVKKFY